MGCRRGTSELSQLIAFDACCKSQAVVEAGPHAKGAIERAGNQTVDLGRKGDLSHNVRMIEDLVDTAKFAVFQQLPYSNYKIAANSSPRACVFEEPNPCLELVELHRFERSVEVSMEEVSLAEIYPPIFGYHAKLAS